MFLAIIPFKEEFNDEEKLNYFKDELIKASQFFLDF
jgi:hypothetical protein